MDTILTVTWKRLEYNVVSVENGPFSEDNCPLYGQKMIFWIGKEYFLTIRWQSTSDDFFYDAKNQLRQSNLVGVRILARLVLQQRNWNLIRKLRWKHVCLTIFLYVLCIEQEKEDIPIFFSFISTPCFAAHKRNIILNHFVYLWNSNRIQSVWFWKIKEYNHKMVIALCLWCIFWLLHLDLMTKTTHCFDKCINYVRIVKKMTWKSSLIVYRANQNVVKVIKSLK